MLRSPLGLLLTWLTRVWPTAGGAGWSVRGGKRVGLDLSAAGGGGAEDFRLDLTGLRPLGDLGVCIAVKCVVKLQYGKGFQQPTEQATVFQLCSVEALSIACSVSVKTRQVRQRRSS